MTIDTNAIASLFVGPKSKKSLATGLALLVTCGLFKAGVIQWETFQDVYYVLGALFAVFLAFAVKKLAPTTPLDIPEIKPEDCTAPDSPSQIDMQAVALQALKDLLAEKKEGS